MPVRSVVLFNIGPAFGGFRSALRPGALGLDHPEAFTVIEAALTKIFEQLAHTPFEQWRALARAPESEHLVPRLGNRKGVIDFLVAQDNDGTRHLIARGMISFPYWPVGGWIVHDGRHFNPQGDVTPYTPEELAPVW
jgi:hypothetical protein